MRILIGHGRMSRPAGSEFWCPFSLIFLKASTVLFGISTPRPPRKPCIPFPSARKRRYRIVESQRFEANPTRITSFFSVL
jgi:hypothetical protein